MGKIYNILDWIDLFEKEGGEVDPKEDFLESREKILYPGRFYVLDYKAKTKDRYNSRPVLIGMGISKKDPDSFLCVDLSVIPVKVRMKFIEMFFNIYYDEITDSIDKYMYVEDANKQTWMRTFSYDNLIKTMPMIPIKNAIKRYKIENIRKIYAVPFQKVYKIIGRYCDEDYYVNGRIGDVQKEFIQKVRK